MTATKRSNKTTKHNTRKTVARLWGAEWTRMCRQIELAAMACDRCHDRTLNKFAARFRDVLWGQLEILELLQAVETPEKKSSKKGRAK